MAAAPPLSVLFPVRNGRETVREALESILHQSFSDFEFLVVDDGSTDGTGEVLREAAREDARIRLISQEPSGIVLALEVARAKHEGHSWPEWMPTTSPFPSGFKSRWT